MKSERLSHKTRPHSTLYDKKCKPANFLSSGRGLRCRRVPFWYLDHCTNVVIPSVALVLNGVKELSVFPSVILDLIGDPVSLQWHVTIIIDGYRKVDYASGPQGVVRRCGNTGL
jgi:hypothetical protein